MYPTINGVVINKQWPIITHKVQHIELYEYVSVRVSILLFRIDYDQLRSRTTLKKNKHMYCVLCTSRRDIVSRSLPPSPVPI